jgi:asparagine synthase (glutamine-hydrolysing)
MCGFAGFLTPNTDTKDALEAIAARMAQAIAHRGPDNSGAWADAQAGIALGHRRLSIVDLSAAGHQPMHSASQRYVMAFNGEIYNHMELRFLLEAQGWSTPWRGHADTETLLAGCEVWGLEETLRRAVGMFAIALWDTRTSTLQLARDRFGEKPLYYGWICASAKSAFVFGSELKALRAYPSFANPVSREILALYMRFTYVPAPYSIYQGIYKLEPGCVLTLNGVLADHSLVAPAQALRPHATHAGLTLRRWWALADVVQTGAQRQFVNETEAVAELERTLQEAVRVQSLADVPLGAFLSGGVDSSTIVALMQQQASQPVKTFTVGFEEAGFDESLHARVVARHLGTEHSELFVSATEVQAVIPQLPQIYDEPFADSSQIPTYLLCKAARQQVTVALSGDAGDELFGGYNRYLWGPRIWSRLAWLPYPARQVLCNASSYIPGDALNLFAKYLHVLRPDEKLQKLTRSLKGAHNLDSLYRNLVSECQDPALVVKGVAGLYKGVVQEPPSLLDDPFPAQGVEQSQLRMMYRDSITYLPDDILCKVDRAAMATSLETRVPYLDHRVAELVWQLPLNMKIRGNEGKWALRQVLYKHVPRELIDRPKAGFAIPLGQWLRGPLHDWAESLLAESRLQAEGYFHPSTIRTKWAEHLSGRRDHTPSLWSVLMFQAWLEQVR